MRFFNTIINKYSSKRLAEIDNFKKNPIQIQEKTLQKLISNSKNSEFGKKYDLSKNKTYSTFQQNLPIHEYEDIKPYIDKLLNLEENILFSQKINCFAKSSGTTNSRSKFIPISKEFLYECHFQSGKDVFFIYYNAFPNTKIFSKKTLSIGGSTDISTNKEKKLLIGDLSAIIINY